MSDIDFDELDRAVASVLQGPGDAAQPTEVPASAATPATPVSSPAATSEPVPTARDASVPVTVTARPAPVVATVAPVAADKPAAASAQDLHTQPVKPIQRGRFLDMVHPSQDMSTVSARPATPPAPTPVAPAVNQTFVSDVIAPTAPTFAPENRPAPTRETVIQPLSAPSSPSVAPQAEPDEAVDFFAALPDETDKTAESPASPFIPDAKVEKRPLGAFSSESPAGGTFPMGKDLHNELVHVESEDNIIEAAETPVPATPNVPTSPITQKTAAKKPEPFATFSSNITSVPTPASAPAVSAAAPKPMAAPAKPADQPDAHFNLFDHKDVAPKARSEKVAKYGKGTWIWVTVAIAVMLIGFGVGATLYFVVLH